MSIRVTHFIGKGPEWFPQNRADLRIFPEGRTVSWQNKCGVRAARGSATWPHRDLVSRKDINSTEGETCFVTLRGITSRSHLPVEKVQVTHSQRLECSMSKKRLVVYALLAALASAGIGAVVAPSAAAACVWSQNNC